MLCVGALEAQKAKYEKQLSELKDQLESTNSSLKPKPSVLS